MMNLFLKRLFNKLSACMLLLIFSASAFASSTGGSNLPFVTNTQKLADAITAWLFPAAVIMMIVTFLMLSFGDWTESFKRILKIAFGLSCAFGAGTLVTMFGGSGALI